MNVAILLIGGFFAILLLTDTVVWLLAWRRYGATESGAFRVIDTNIVVICLNVAVLGVLVAIRVALAVWWGR